MMIFNDDNHPIIIDSIYTPVLSNFFWILDLEMMDYTITPLLTLEEIISPSMVLQIEGFTFNLPASWNILVVDNETSQLDLIESNQLAGKAFNAFTFGPHKWTHKNESIKVINFASSFIHTGPSLNKHQMLCHPIGPDTWVNVAPSDTFNRYLKNRVAGDLT